LKDKRGEKDTFCGIKRTPFGDTMDRYSLFVQNPFNQKSLKNESLEKLCFLSFIFSFHF